jgi:hypothetical protein
LEDLELDVFTTGGKVALDVAGCGIVKMEFPLGSVEVAGITGVDSGLSGGRMLNVADFCSSKTYWQ